MLTKYLKAAAIFASKEGTRYYLNGVHVRPFDKGLQIIATDGHRMFLAYDAEAFEDNETTVSEPITIPSETIKKALTGFKDQMIVLRCEDGIRGTLNDVRFSPIDGDFPAFERVFPSELSGDVAQFNPQYVADFGKAAKIVDGSRSGMVHIHHNGGSPALVSFADHNCIGVLMPMRSEGGNPMIVADRLIGRMHEKTAGQDRESYSDDQDRDNYSAAA